MHRHNVRTLVLATVVALVSSALLPSSAEARTGGHAKRVCKRAAAHHATCSAVVVTGGSARPRATIGYEVGLTPGQLRTAYDVSGDGHRTIAVVDAYANPRAADDLAVYRARFGLPPAALTQVDEHGGPALPRGNVSWGQEEMLDLEMASAICPSCPLLYIAAATTSLVDFGAAVDTAVRLGATVVSNSYGGPEFASETSYAAHYDHPGVAIVASSGDSGFGVEVPAAYGTVTAVGGTTLALDAGGRRVSETAWSGAGSGCSRYVAKPAWQHDSGCARRTVADVAAVADPATGVAVYDSYGSRLGANWFVFGGTSVAAPIVAGIYGLSADTAGVPAARAYTGTGLVDITEGANGRCAVTYLCTAGPGYDGPTGLGAPSGTSAF